MKSAILLFLFSIIVYAANAQKISFDPKWENYYKKNPARVYEHYQATDFINVIDSLGFVPVSRVFEKKVFLLKRALLMATQDELEVLSSEGWYYSQTAKHDDFFYLYNMTYKEITKEIWDVYCPYLIPLMNLDGAVDLK